MNSIELQQHIIAFISEIETCAKSTAFAGDRPVYLQDIATASSWLVKLNRGVLPDEVVKEILSPQIDKAFGDYWRQGVWGDFEANALKKLRETIS